MIVVLYRTLFFAFTVKNKNFPFSTAKLVVSSLNDESKLAKTTDFFQIKITLISGIKLVESLNPTASAGSRLDGSVCIRVS